MINEIVKFSGMLRENGIPASIRSTKIACDAFPLIEKNNGNLKEALACIYLKDQRQRKKFNELYESFFDKTKEEKEISSGLGDKSKFLKKYNVSISTKRVSDFDSGR